MHNTTDIALSRLVAQQRAMDVTANNMANADTPGFKTQRVLFSDWLSRQGVPGVAQGDRLLAYTQDRATYRDDAPGPLNQTGNPLDLAISGEGFFTVRTDEGVRLTRAGRFTLSSDGTVTDLNGNALLDTSGAPLSIPPGDTNISIAGDGTLSTRTGTIGTVAVVRANEPNGLRAEGGRLLATDAGTTPVTAPTMVQGAVEGSNVQPVLEMTRMMNQLREFQYVAQFVQAEGDRTQSAIDKITRRS